MKSEAGDKLGSHGHVLGAALWYGLWYIVLSW